MEMLMTLRPRISEKAYDLSQKRNVYVFEVPANANKLTIASAVGAQFKVVVTNVNISNLTGKNKRTIKRGGRQTFGKRPDVKKAYVTLKPGDNIAIFANEEDKKESKAAKKEKK